MCNIYVHGGAGGKGGTFSRLWFNLLLSQEVLIGVSLCWAQGCHPERAINLYMRKLGASELCMYEDFGKPWPRLYM